MKRSCVKRSHRKGFYESDSSESGEDTIERRHKELSSALKFLEQQFLSLREAVYQCRMLQLDLDRVAYSSKAYDPYNDLAKKLFEQYISHRSDILKLRRDKLISISHKFASEERAAGLDFKQEQESIREVLRKKIRKERRHILHKLRALRKKKAKELRKLKG